MPDEEKTLFIEGYQDMLRVTRYFEGSEGSDTIHLTPEEQEMLYRVLEHKLGHEEWEGECDALHH